MVPPHPGGPDHLPPRAIPPDDTTPAAVPPVDHHLKRQRTSSIVAPPDPPLLSAAASLPVAIPDGAFVTTTSRPARFTQASLRRGYAAYCTQL